MLWRTLRIAALCAAALSTPCLGQDFGKVTSQKVADGVYLFRTSGYGDVGMSGNSVAVLSNDGVLVFDSTGLPETAQTILGEIRKLTDEPVRFLVNSHWHWDHWGGNQVYAAAFPALPILTQENTRQQMVEVEPRWNKEGLEKDLPEYLAQLEKKIASDKAKGVPAEKIKEMEALLAADRNFLEQKRTLTKTYPNVTFSDSATLWLGDREIRVLHARAITTGDTYLYLPKEKILITGDILLDPYPYAIGGTYPATWLATLQAFAKLDAAIIIPGHGAPQDKAFLERNIAVFQEIMDAVKTAKQQGMSLEQTTAAVGAQAATLAMKLGISDAGVQKEFKAYFLDVFVARAYKELQGPLPETPFGD